MSLQCPIGLRVNRAECHTMACPQGPNNAMMSDPKGCTAMQPQRAPTRLNAILNGRLAGGPKRRICMRS